MSDTESTATSTPASSNNLAALAQLRMGRVLYPLVNFATAIATYFHARQFFFPDSVLRYSPDAAYVTLLAAYAGHREVRRWTNDPTVIADRARRGEFFVVGWWSAYFTAVLIANHTRRYEVPGGLLALCMQLTAIFFGTLTSQQVFKGKRDDSTRSPESEGRRAEDRVRAYLSKATGLVRRKQVEVDLDLSRPTVQRALERLVDRGEVEWTGESKTDPTGGFRARPSSN